MNDKVEVDRADLEALLSVPWVVALADWNNEAGRRAYLAAGRRVRESLGTEPVRHSQPDDRPTPKVAVMPDARPVRVLPGVTVVPYGLERWGVPSEDGDDAA